MSLFLFLFNWSASHKYVGVRKRLILSLPLANSLIDGQYGPRRKFLSYIYSCDSLGP
jgi:hypothetical protein